LRQALDERPQGVRPNSGDEFWAVMAATSHRAVTRKLNVDVEDVLIALATADCAARDLLQAHRITLEALRRIVDREG
jgi:hypothetical protein